METKVVPKLYCINCKKPMPYFYARYGEGGVCSRRCDDEYRDRAKVEEEGL